MHRILPGVVVGVEDKVVDDSEILKNTTGNVSMYHNITDGSLKYVVLVKDVSTYHHIPNRIFSNEGNLCLSRQQSNKPLICGRLNPQDGK